MSEAGARTFNTFKVQDVIARTYPGINMGAYVANLPNNGYYFSELEIRNALVSLGYDPSLAIEKVLRFRDGRHRK